MGDKHKLFVYNHAASLQVFQVQVVEAQVFVVEAPPQVAPSPLQLRLVLAVPDQRLRPGLRRLRSRLRPGLRWLQRRLRRLRLSYGPFNGGYGGYGNSVYGGTFGGFNGGFNNGFNGGAFGGYPQFQQVGGFEQQPQVVEQQPQQEGNVVYQNGGNIGNAYPVQQFGGNFGGNFGGPTFGAPQFGGNFGPSFGGPGFGGPGFGAPALAARVASTERFIPVR